MGCDQGQGSGSRAEVHTAWNGRGEVVLGCVSGEGAVLWPTHFCDQLRYRVCYGATNQHALQQEQMSNPKLPSAIVKIATAEIGVEEVNGSNCGPRVNEYKAATWLDPKHGWPWCAAFVCWVVREALASTGVAETKTFKRPRTAGALDLENWSLAQDDSTNTKAPPRGDIIPGDIVTFKFNTGGHVGIAVSTPDKNGYVTTIEGNTNSAGSREGGGVFRKRRNVSEFHGRIRFLV